MKQMLAPKAPVIARMQFSELSCGFFRNDGIGRVLFAAERAGGKVYCFPVMEDGKISRSSSVFPSPLQEIEVIHPSSLGISGIVWADN